MYEGLNVSTYLLTLACVSLFYYSYSSECEVASHCASNLDFPIMASDAKQVVAFTRHLFTFFREIYSDPLPIYLACLSIIKY